MRGVFRPGRAQSSASPLWLAFIPDHLQSCTCDLPAVPRSLLSCCTRNEGADNGLLHNAITVQPPLRIKIGDHKLEQPVFTYPPRFLCSPLTT